MHAGSFCVSLIHQTLTDYRIFNVTTWSLLCVRIHRGWAQTASQHNIFLLWKTPTSFFIVLLMGFEPQVMESIWSWGRRSTNWATPILLIIAVSSLYVNNLLSVVGKKSHKGSTELCLKHSLNEPSSACLHPDTTSVVDWALKIKYLSICLSHWFLTLS